MSGIPKWLLDQKAHAAKVNTSCGALLPNETQVDSRELKQLIAEHDHFREALIRIASGGSSSIARDVLGTFRHPDNLLRQIKMLEDENATLRAALQGATDNG